MATTMLSAGVPVSIVAGRLGHSGQSTTPNVYSHFSPAGDRDAADTISRILSETVLPDLSDTAGRPTTTPPRPARMTIVN